MNFTFGIITSGNNDNFLSTIIKSIEDLNIPSYEIIIVGNSTIKGNFKHIIFNENEKSNWITKKKNLITKHALYDNVVYLHDYLYFEKDWYNGFLNFKEDWKVCMNPIINTNGTRYRDWTLWTDADPILNNRNFLIPYNIKHLSKIMYISGAYWVAKKDIMIENPLDESLSWGESEDIVWSKLIRSKYDFSININSKVKLLKYKEPIFGYATERDIEILNKIKF